LSPPAASVNDGREAADKATSRKMTVARTASSVAPGGPSGGRLRRLVVNNERLLLGTLGIALILGLWELGSATGYLNKLIMSSPTGVAEAFQVEVARGEIWGHLWISIVEFTLGFLIAAVVGISVGLVAGWWHRAFFAIDPWVTILYSTPTVALVPLIILIFGIGVWSKVFVVFLISVFPVIVNTLAGVQSTSRSLVDVARSFGATPRKQWTSVVLPGAVPFILTGLRLAGVHGMVGVVVAELIAGNEGVGFVINLAGASLRTGTVMLMILFLGLWGVAFGELMQRVENRFESWRT
jgi:NitT/TauT family transport system permease protein